MATKVKLIADNVITTSQIDTSSLDSHFTGGTGVTYSSGTISIGQAVATTDNVTFADLTVTGDLNITGDINSYNVTDLDVTDKTITLGAGQIESNSGGSGIIVDGSNASILWDETNDVFDINKGLTTLGNVGIGTTSPSAGLHIRTDVNPVLKLDRGSANNTNANLYYNGTFTGQLSAASAEFQISAVGSSTPTTFFTNGSEVARLDTTGNLLIGTNSGTSIQLNVDGSRANGLAAQFTNSQSSTGSGIVVKGGSSSSNYSADFRDYNNNSLMRVRGDGNVGIGTTSPSADLHIGKTSGAAVLKVDTTATADAGIQIKGYDAYVALGDNTNGLQWYVWNDGPSSSSSLKFGSQALSASDWYADASQAMVITSSGNVLLGTTNASAPGLTINELLNLSFGTGNNNESYVNFFRQTSSAAAVMATGYRRSTTANKMESSIGTSWAKSAITANYGQIILYTDPASADAVGTTLTPTERLRVYDNGIIGINKPSGPADGGFGTPAIVAKQWVNSDWGGLNIEANGNDSVFSFSNSDTSHIIAGSYRTTAGYKDIVIKAGGGEKMRVRQAGGISIQNSGTYEIDFEGANSTNIRSQRAIYFLYDNGNNGDAYFGIGHNSDNAVNMLGRYKTSSGTNGSATGFIATSFGNSNGQTSIGQLGLEPEAPFHILKGGLTMNGYETPGVYRYLHSNSDTGQWMHMNAAGRSGSGVANFELYIPTAQVGSSWGSFGGDLFLSGYNGQHEYIIWRGYTNSGLAGASGTVVSGTGSPTITVGQNGTFGFYVKVSNISMTHPIAMYRVCKGGNPGREWDLSEISCRWY